MLVCGKDTPIYYILHTIYYKELFMPLQPNEVKTEHLAPGAVTTAKLSFAPPATLYYMVV